MAIIKRYGWIFFLFLVAAGFGFYRWILVDLPALESIGQRVNQPSVRITDRNGRLLYEMLPEGGGRNAVRSLNQIPLALQQATIATEDAHFYQNPGVELSGILRSVWINLRGGEVPRGRQHDHPASRSQSPDEHGGTGAALPAPQAA